MSERISVGGIEADIIIDTSNLDGALEKVRSGLAKVDAAIGELQTEFQAAGGDVKAFESQLEHLVATKQALLEVEQRLASAVSSGTADQRGATSATNAAAQATRTAAESARGMSTQMRGAGLAAISASRGFQDVAQAGPAAALNNLEFASAGVAQAFGATVPQAMAIGAAVQGVATAALLLYENWDPLMDAFGVGIPAPALDGLKAITAELKRVQHELDETAKKARLSLPEQVQFEQNQRRARALGGIADEEKALAQGEGPTKEERERGSAFSEAVKAQGGSAAVRDALASEYNDRAAESGSLLGGEQIRSMLKEAGYDPASLEARDVPTVGSMFGVPLDAQAIQEKADSGGPSIGEQVMEALKAQRFIADDATGGMATPGQLARRQIARGMAGDKTAGGEVADILDRRLGNADGLSAFGREFGTNSPEGKADQKRINESMKKRDEDKKKTSKEELEAADLADEELQESIKQMRETREKNKRNRERNERESREAAPGIDTMAEVLASQALGGAMSSSDALAMIRQNLKAAGRTDKQADAAAEDIFADADREVREGVVRRMYEGSGQEREQARTSEVFDANSVAARFQSSVGGGEDKKQTSILEDIRKSLDEMAKAGTLNVRIKKS